MFKWTAKRTDWQAKEPGDKADKMAGTAAAPESGVAKSDSTAVALKVSPIDNVADPKISAIAALLEGKGDSTALVLEDSTQKRLVKVLVENSA